MKRAVTVITSTLFLAVGALAVALRFVRLDWSFSFDEAYIGAITRLPWHEVFSIFRLESDHTPLYYALVKLWAGVAGSGDKSLRVFSALAGSLAAAAIGFASGVLWSRRARIIGFALGSASSMLFFLSREARMYPLLALFSALSVLAFWRWLGQPTARRTVWYSMATLAALATHPTALSLLAAQTLFIIIGRGYRTVPPRALVAAAGIFTLAIGAWFAVNSLPRMLHPLGLPTWVTDRPTPWGAALLIRDFVTYYHGTHALTGSTQVMAFVVLRVAYWLVVGAAVLTALTLTAGERRQPARFLAFTLLIGLLPAMFVRPEPKFFIVPCVAFLMLATGGFVHWRRRMPIATAVAAAVLTVFSSLQLPAIVRGQGLPWKPAAVMVSTRAQPTDLILVHQWPDELTMKRYYRGTATVQGVFPLDAPERTSFLARAARYNAAQVITLDNIGSWLQRTTQPYRRVWLIYGNPEPFFNGPLVYQWFLNRGWVIRQQPRLPYAPPDFLTLFERTGGAG